jgi:hypothetical protein
MVTDSPGAAADAAQPSAGGAGGMCTAAAADALLRGAVIAAGAAPVAAVPARGDGTQQTKTGASEGGKSEGGGSVELDWTRLNAAFLELPGRLASESALFLAPEVQRRIAPGFIFGMTNERSALARSATDALKRLVDAGGRASRVLCELVAPDLVKHAGTGNALNAKTAAATLVHVFSRVASARLVAELVRVAKANTSSGLVLAGAGRAANALLTHWPLAIVARLFADASAADGAAALLSLGAQAGDADVRRICRVNFRLLEARAPRLAPAA